MRKRDPRPVMVIDEGTCQLIGEANEFDGVQEPLPDAMSVLLCLIDGAERRHRLVRKWQSRAAHDLHVEVGGGGIVVTLPGTSYAVTYYKLANSPQLHGKYCRIRSIDGVRSRAEWFVAIPFANSSPGNVRPRAESQEAA